jgi:hypothetical protein
MTKLNYPAAIVYGEAAVKLSFPESERLFAERQLYDWVIKDDLATAYNMVGRAEEGMQLAKEILEEHGHTLPEKEKKRLQTNLNVITGGRYEEDPDA